MIISVFLKYEFRLFLTSMSLVVFFFLVLLIRFLKGEIIWYLSLTAWLISLCIMLSSSIHATIKDTWTKSRGRVEVEEGGGFGWGGVEGWGEKAYNCN